MSMDSLNSKLKPEGWTASREITFHTSATFMDYLHGDIEDDEVKTACLYEFARESKDMWDTARLRNEARLCAWWVCLPRCWGMKRIVGPQQSPFCGSWNLPPE